MKKKHNIFEKLAVETGLLDESFPAQPVVEIVGEHRVLIENHSGVIEYTAEQIGVNVKYGQINVCGSDMELIQMTKEQLVVSGRIESVFLIRRDKT